MLLDILCQKNSWFANVSFLLSGVSDMEAGQYGLDGRPLEDDSLRVVWNEAVIEADVPLDIFQLLW